MNTTTFEKMAVLGRLGADAELRYTPQGLPILSMSVAIDLPTKDGQAKTAWRRVTAFGEPAEALTAAGLFTKGTLVYAEGRPEVHEWTAKDGAHHADLRLVAAKIEPLAAFRPRPTSGPGAPTGQLPEQPDDLPF